MPNRTAHPRPIPALLSPRLPIGRRWATFCRSAFARHLRASARATLTTLAAVSAVVMLYVGLDVAAAAYLSFGGTL